MLILFDQGTPVLIAKSLTGHSVKTAYELGWDTLKNGELLDAAEEAGFDVLLTTDKKLPHQQNFSGRKIAIVILGRNRWKSIQRVLSDVAAAIDTAARHLHDRRSSRRLIFAGRHTSLLDFRS